MKTKILTILFSISLYCESYSQVTQEWASIFSYGVLYNDITNSITTDDSGNVYVTGQSGVDVLSNSYDYLTIKYNSSGIQQWIQRYNGPGMGNDYAYSIAVDDSGNVYVTGWSSGKGTDFDYATIKYNSNGVMKWVQRYNGPVNNRDGANSLTLDSFGNVYVTGVSYRSSFGIYDDYTTIKYNSDGDSVWVRGYNGPGNWNDVANSISVDDSDNVYVTGYSAFSSGSNYDYATIKYNSNGDSIWVNRYNGPANNDDKALSLAIDDLGNVFVTGYSFGNGTNYDYATLMYNSSGVQQWIQRYNGTGNQKDYANSITIDNNRNVFVTGASFGNGTDSDYATIKYNSNGVQQWVQRYNGLGNNKDYARSIAVDSFGNSYVTGWSFGSGTNYDFATIKYDTAGIQKWVQRYSNYNDGANSIAVDDKNNVYVTGNSSTGPPLVYYRSATIKYSQTVGINLNSILTPTSFSLSQNYPNPFNPRTVISYELRITGNAMLKVFDVLGNKVAELINEKQIAGSYSVEFDGSNFSSGVYFYKLTAGDFVETKRMILLK